MAPGVGGRASGAAPDGGLREPGSCRLLTGCRTTTGGETRLRQTRIRNHFGNSKWVFAIYMVIVFCSPTLIVFVFAPEGTFYVSTEPFPSAASKAGRRDRRDELHLFVSVIDQAVGNGAVKADGVATVQDVGVGSDV